MNHKSIREKHESKKFLSETVVALKIFLENLGKEVILFFKYFYKTIKIYTKDDENSCILRYFLF